MKEDVEIISKYYDVSFVCSFGYSIKGVYMGKDRLNDIFDFRNIDTHEMCRGILRRDFFKFIKDRHGGVVKGVRNTNACKEYDLFCFGTKDDISKWTRSRAEQDLMMQDLFMYYE